jgi:hypothetical protein
MDRGLAGLSQRLLRAHLITRVGRVGNRRASASNPDTSRHYGSGDGGELRLANRAISGRIVGGSGSFTTTPGSETPQRIKLDEQAQGWCQLVGNGVFL